MGGREASIDAVTNETLDVAIIGGGINGACLYHLLCRRGYRVLLIDQGDFASGTSQASAMMIWGGLLYLGSLDLPAVYSFSTSRDRMIKTQPEWASPCRFRFLPARHGLLSKVPVTLALYLYWLIGRFNRSRPKIERRFSEKALLARENLALQFEEGMISPSDARFVLHWIVDQDETRGTAINYCELLKARRDKHDNAWRLELRDRIEGREIETCVRAVVNCAGVWTDRVNADAGISSPYKHVFSKGVFLGMEPGGQESPLIFDMGEHNDVITSIPWGPINLWGPTETAIQDLEAGFAASPDDIEFLLEHYNRCYRHSATRRNIVSIRCGVRPLAVNARYDRKEYPLELSRRSRIAFDRQRAWISVYGSKLTGCEKLADSIAQYVERLIPAPLGVNGGRPADQTEIPVTSLPGLGDELPTIDWCMRHEYCCTLDDYLRRRTNIAQWVPREGLGWNDEHVPILRDLCLEITRGDKLQAERQLKAYRNRVAQRFDRVLGKV